MKEKDKEEEIFEDELSGMYSTFVLAKKRLQNTPPNPTMDNLRALIKSKGIDVPPSRTKKPLQDVWDEVKDKDDWERTVFFDYMHQVEIDELEALVSS